MTAMDIVKYSFPTEIWFGPGTANQLGTRLLQLGLKRPLFVTDRGLSNQPIVVQILQRLRADHLDVGVFVEIWGNPVLSQVSAGVAAYRSHDADCIIAMGGGAAMDVAKAIGLMTKHPGALFDYEDGKPDMRTFDQKMPFLVALPTTSGTGSEVGRSTVISDDITKVKKIIFHPILLPRLVLADPELTLELPASITASTGMDALSHLLESFIARGFHPICDGIALEGIHILSTSLKQCVNAARGRSNSREEQLLSRGMMMNAAMMGAIAFQKGLGVTHSCAHALSTVCDLHHGLANGIMLPYAMTFNFDVASDRFARIARVIDPTQTKPDYVIHWLHELKREIDIPEKLSAVGVTQSHHANLVAHALADGCHLSNPRTVTKSDFESIFVSAF